MARLDKGNILNMNRRKLWMLLLLALAVVGMVLSVEARVFLRRGLFMRGGRFDFSAIGQQLYTTVMEVNGQEKAISVIKATERGEGVAGMVRESGGKMWYESGAEIGLGEISRSGLRAKVLMLPVDNSETVVIVVQSRMAEATGSPKDANWGGMPIYHAAELKQMIRNQGTAALLCQAETSDAPGTVMEYYRAELEGKGWNRVLPGGDVSVTAGLACFVKGADMCLVFCRASETGGGTQLTLVNKRGGLK